MSAALPVLSVVGLAEREQPLLAYLDQRTGQRQQLTAAELGDWSARAAGLLRDGCGLIPGSRVAVLLPPHPRTAAVLLGAWSVGLEVSFRPRATAGLPVLEPGGERPYDAVLVTPERLDDWLEDVPDGVHRYLVGTGPEPLTEVPAGWLDWSSELLRHGGFPADRPLLHATDSATPDGTSYAEWGQLAQAVAEQLDLRAGDRLLVDVAEHDHPLKWLLAPLAAGASVVLCTNLDPAHRDTVATAEQVTRIL
ncbi:TIGR03089 family protein [Micromonospora sp. FIMYZ51]|uniref:TIGR03089 family protein n=1 Tax=Micromonospora sp. FIMYZ51 TaxID=3051832 RepID=UPI00311D3880